MKENDYVYALERIQMLLGHDIGKVYFPAYGILQSSLKDETLNSKQRFIFEFAHTAMIYGLTFTPTVYIFSFFPKDEKSFNKFIWRFFLVKYIFGECFNEEVLDECLKKILELWDFNPEIIKFSDPELFNQVHNETDLVPYPIKVMQLLILIATDSILKYVAIHVNDVPIRKIWDLYELDYPKEPITISTKIHCQNITIVSSTPIADYKLPSIEHFFQKCIDDICRFIWVSNGIEYKVEDVLSTYCFDNKYIVRVDMEK